MRDSAAAGPPASHRDREVRRLFALGGAGGAAFIPFFALLLRARGFAPDEIGLVLAASSLTGVLALPVWSHVADERLGSARTLAIASASAGVIALALTTTGSQLWAVVTVAGVLGIAQAPGTALGDSLALTHLGRERETEYGTIRLWSSIGWGVAVIAFGALFQRTGLEVLLPVYAALVIAYAALAGRFPPNTPSRDGNAIRSRLGSVGEALRSSPRFPSFLVGLFLVSVAASASFAFVPLRIAARGGGPFLVGLAAGLTAFVEIPFFNASARLASRFGLRALYLAGAGGYVVTMVLWALIADPTLVAIVKVAGGAGFGLIYAALVLITGRLVPVRLRNTGQAIMQTTNQGIAPIVGQGVGGLVYAHLGPATLFAAAAVCTAAGAVVVWFSLSGAALRGERSPAAGVVPQP